MVVTFMKIICKQTFLLLTIPLFFLFLCVSHSYAGSAEDKKGWGNDDEYNQLYSPKESDKLRGRVDKFKKIKPLPGMSNATVLVLDDDGDKIMVHLCPVWFATAKDTGIKRGDKVKIKGSWAEIDDEDIFMASKVKKGEHYEFKVRLTSDGTPFWNMTPEQLAHEKATP